MKDLLRTQGFNDTQIEEMRNFTAQNKDNLSALNLTQAHDQLASAYVQAIRDSANTSLLVLQNSMFFNREANLTASLTNPQVERFDLLRTRAVADLALLNWSGLESSAKGFAGMAFDLALQTGSDFFAEITKFQNLSS